jgi:hypothetical protein
MQTLAESNPTIPLELLDIINQYSDDRFRMFLSNLLLIDKKYITDELVWKTMVVYNFWYGNEDLFSEGKIDPQKFYIMLLYLLNYHQHDNIEWFQVITEEQFDNDGVFLLITMDLCVPSRDVSNAYMFYEKIDYATSPEFLNFLVTDFLSSIGEE